MKFAVYSADNPVFAAFSFYAALLVAKVLAMAFLTGRQRMSKRAFANPEDAALTPGGKVKQDDDVERVRRAHLNDLENIVPFLIIAIIYVGTGPSLSWAKLLFRTFTVARFVHTLVYAVFVIPQPSRAIAFIVGMLVNFYMIFSILTHYLHAM